MRLLHLDNAVFDILFPYELDGFVFNSSTLESFVLPNSTHIDFNACLGN